MGGTAPSEPPHRGGRRSLRLELRRAGPVGVVVASGVLDIHTIALLEREVLELLSAGTVQIVVDLAGIRICDAAAMGGLLRAYRAATALGGSLRLAGPGPLVAESFSIVGFGGDVPVYRGVTAALERDESRRLKP
ncbi:STAS domain-containing protein [Dactylosporangium sp. CA-092794]|uniref:STAS domain-containing protein n=1 Tax=Dactylosporangium sp. CA-092794 TaxID=3239929 RepID=UPI003D8D290A